MMEDTTLVVTAANGLLQGAVDPNNDAMEVVNASIPLKGNLTVQKNGSFVYVPFKDAFGQDYFTFWVSDNKGGFSKGMVNITIGRLMGVIRALNFADQAKTLKHILFVI